MSDHHEAATWQCHLTVDKYHGDDLTQAPYETLEFDYNMLLAGGVSALWQYMLGNGTTTGSQALTYFNTTNAAIGVGDSSTAAVATQTDLQGSNKLRKPMGAGYPQHVDGVTVAAQTIRFVATFDTASANFAWEEAGIFNSVTLGTGRMLNRKVQAMGTKTSASSWQITFDVTIS